LTPSPVTLCHTSRDPYKVGLRHTSRTPQFLVVHAFIHNLCLYRGVCLSSRRFLTGGFCPGLLSGRFCLRWFLSARLLSEYIRYQRRESGLFNLGGHGSGLTQSWQISENFRFFQAISLKKSIFPGKFSKNFDFSDYLGKKSNFQAKIGHLQLLLGKLFYFSSKVTTSNILPVHDKI